MGIFLGSFFEFCIVVTGELLDVNVELFFL